MITKQVAARIRPLIGSELTETHIKGIPVIAEFSVGCPDKSVGIFDRYVDDCSLYNSRGYRLKWLEAKMTREDWELLHEKLLDC